MGSCKKIRCHYVNENKTYNKRSDSKTISHCGVSSSGDLNVTDLSKSDLNSGNSYYLCFTISQRTNKMMMNGNDRYSEEQENTHKLIKSLRDEGLGYRKIQNSE